MRILLFVRGLCVVAKMLLICMCVDVCVWGSKDVIDMYVCRCMCMYACMYACRCVLGSVNICIRVYVLCMHMYSSLYVCVAAHVVYIHVFRHQQAT